MASAGANVTDCSWDYAACLMNPWDGPLACYPDSFALPSTRFRVRKVFDIKVGEIGTTGSGYGFISVDPILAMANNLNSVFWTDGSATYTGDAFVQAGTGVVSGALGQGTIANADYASTLTQGRVISVGVRAWYTGSIMNCAGQILAYESPDHQNLTNLDWGDLSARPGVQVVPVAAGRKFHIRSSGPKNPAERDYSISPSGTSTGAFLGLIISAPKNLTFTAEVSVVYEVVGKRNLNPSPTKQDAVGLSHVNTVFNALGPQGFSSAFSDSSIWPRLISGVSSVAKVALGMSAAAATPAVSSILTSLRTPGLGVLPRVLM